MKLICSCQFRRLDVFTSIYNFLIKLELKLYFLGFEVFEKSFVTYRSEL